MNKIVHEYTHYITCPYCGYEDRDSWELSDNDGETYCSKCEEEFTYERQITVTYSTSKIEEEPLVCKHCGKEKIDVRLRIDPYRIELYNDESLYPLCDDCTYDSAMSI